jgi:hypothetical protein
MDTNNPSGGDTQLKQTGTGHLGIVKVSNSSGEGAEIRKARAGARADYFQLAPGATLHLPAPSGGLGAIEFRLPNGRTLVQAVDARTTRVDLVREGEGYRTVITSAPVRAANRPKGKAVGRG